MKRLILAASIALLACEIAAAQERQQSAATPDNTTARPIAAKSITVSGKVSNDGRSLITDLDTEWDVENRDALKGREGSFVTVKCYIDSNLNRLRIVAVKTAPSEVRYASRLGDSAFRR